MEFSIVKENDFYPSTVEHRPLHLPEKVELKKYFATSGADEYEGFEASGYATCTELSDFEAWVWGLRLWGREVTVRGAVAATRLLQEAWDAAAKSAENDLVALAAAHSQVLTPVEAASIAMYWAHIPSEEKAIRILEKYKPLPDDWFESPLHDALQEKVFFWGALVGWRLIQGILDKRDPAAVGLAEACCGVARVRMLAGRTPAQAVEDVRDRMIRELRTWMGHKW